MPVKVGAAHAQAGSVRHPEDVTDSAEVVLAVLKVERLAIAQLGQKAVQQPWEPSKAPGSEPGTQWKSTRRGRGSGMCTVREPFSVASQLTVLFCSVAVHTHTGCPQQGCSIQGSTRGAYAAPRRGPVNLLPRGVRWIIGCSPDGTARTLPPAPAARNAGSGGRLLHQLPERRGKERKRWHRKAGEEGCGQKRHTGHNKTEMG